MLQCELCCKVASPSSLTNICYLLGHRFDDSTPIEETVTAIFFSREHQCSKRSGRCKPCMTLYKLVMCVILEWVPVTLGNVSKLPIFELHFQVLTSFVLSPCYAKYIFAVVYAWKIAHVALLDYAINNKLTPFISMQNHYNLLYREEEREVFPTLKVCWYDRFETSLLNPFPVFRGWIYSVVASCPGSSYAPPDRSDYSWRIRLV